MSVLGRVDVAGTQPLTPVPSDGEGGRPHTENPLMRPIPHGILAAFVLCASDQVPAVEKEGAWILNDWPAARAEARAGRKPIFVVFRCPH